MFLAFTPGPIFLKMSGLNSVASEIAIKKLLFLGRLITEPNMAPTVRNLFQYKAKSYFDTNVTSAGVLLRMSEALMKYDLFHHFESWYNSSTFPPIIYTPCCHRGHNWLKWQTNILNHSSNERHNSFILISWLLKHDFRWYNHINNIIIWNLVKKHKLISLSLVLHNL